LRACSRAESLRENLAPRYDVEREIGAGGMARVSWRWSSIPTARSDQGARPGSVTRSCAERFIAKWTSPRTSAIPISCRFSAGEVGVVLLRHAVLGESLRNRLAPGPEAAARRRNCTSQRRRRCARLRQAQDHPPRHEAREHLLVGVHADRGGFGIAAPTAPPDLTYPGRPADRLPGYMKPEQRWASATSTHGPYLQPRLRAVRDAGGGAAGGSMTEAPGCTTGGAQTSRALQGPRRGRAAVKHDFSRLARCANSTRPRHVTRSPGGLDHGHDGDAMGWLSCDPLRRST